MGQVTMGIGSRLRRLTATVLLMTGVAITVPVLAGIASAHHAEGSASVTCTGVINWTAVSWGGPTEATKTNSNIRVSFAVAPTTLTAPATVTGAFNLANNFQFSGTAQWPTGATSVVVSFKDIGSWGFAPYYIAGPSGTQTDVTLTKPTTCDGTPGVSQAVSCVGGTVNGAGKVVFTFRNISTSPFANSVTYTIPAFNGTAATTFSLAKGQTIDKTYTPIGDGSYTVLITSNTSPTIQTQSFTIDCAAPMPAVSNVASCDVGNGKIIVTLSNSGGESVVFSVTPPTGGASTDYTVVAGGSTDVTFTGLADAMYTILITANGSSFNQTFTVDCDHPAPVVFSAASCDQISHDGSVTVTMSNAAGTEGVTFKVTNPITGVVQDVVVGAGAVATRTFSGFSDGVRSVVVTVPGDATNFTQTFTVACDLAPSYSYTSVCVTGDGVVTVSLKNDGDDVDAIFVLQGTTHTLAAGETKVVALPAYTDGVKTVLLSVNGVTRNFDVTVDCDRPGQPAVDVAQDCANEDGVASLTLKNIGGQLPLDFFVNGTKYTVPADGQVVVPVAGLLDGTNTIVVTQGQTNFNKTIPVLCDKAPTVDHSESCVDGTLGVSDGQVVITLRNNGDDVSVVFTVNGTPTASVAPKGTLVITVSTLVDGPHDFSVSGDGTTFTFSVATRCDHPGTPSISTSQVCDEAHDGKVIIQLTAVGGEKPVVFVVNGTLYPVGPGQTVQAEVTGLNDGAGQKVTVIAGEMNLSFSVDVTCDTAPKVSVHDSCAAFDGTVSILLENLGDDLAVTFNINGVDYVVPPGMSTMATVSGLIDGSYSIALSINGAAQTPLTGVSDCDPVVGVTAVCNTVDTQGAVSLYWYTITNAEIAPLLLNWPGGTVTVAGGASRQIASTTAPLSLKYGDVTLVTAPASQSVCTRDVRFVKELIGQPSSGETYTIRVSRLGADAQYKEVVTFDLLAGTPVTISLPSTLDPAGLDYKFEEINAGTASTSSLSSDQLKLSGNLGETISVVVTNGYSSVQIVKKSLTSTVLAGGFITYTLQATNTGGLALDPVVISDRLPEQVEYSSVSVEGNGATCALAELARPQLLVCTMHGSLPPGGVTNLITLTVKVEGDVTGGSYILNQAKVLGGYAGTILSQNPGGSSSPIAGADLSCLPIIANTVCDLSAQVGVPVSEIDQSGPTTTTTTISRGELPVTGGSNTMSLLALGLGFAGCGCALLISRRRTGR